jgi:hypothetical protein
MPAKCQQIFIPTPTHSSSFSNGQFAAGQIFPNHQKSGSVFRVCHWHHKTLNPTHPQIHLWADSFLEEGEEKAGEIRCEWNLAGDELGGGWSKLNIFPLGQTHTTGHKYI